MTKSVDIGRAAHFMRQWREARGLSLTQMAALIPFGKSTMSRVETGKIPYHQDILEAYARVIGCSAADLIGRAPGSADELFAVLGECTTAQIRQITAIAKIMVENVS